MKRLDNDGKVDKNVCRLLELVKEIPGSNFFYKNTKGVILWHNNYAVQDLKSKKKSLKGLTVFDLYSNESAKICLKDDLQVINSKNIVCKQHNIQLITGDIHKYMMTRIPWMVNLNQVSGIIVNSINLNSFLCQQSKDYYTKNQQDQALTSQLQNLYFNFREPLKEIILLANFIMLGKINDDSKALCLELKNFAKELLLNCDDVLSKNTVNTKQPSSMTLQKINLRKLMQTVFNKQIKVVKPQNTKLFLIISNQIPEIVTGNLLRIEKILNLIVNALLEAALSFDNIDINIYCKIDMFSKINDKNIIVSLLFEVENFLFKEFINNEQQMQNSIKMMSNLYNDNDNYNNNDNDNDKDNLFGLKLVNILLNELQGDMEFINNQTISKLIIRLPLGGVV